MDVEIKHRLAVAALYINRARKELDKIEPRKPDQYTALDDTDDLLLMAKSGLDKIKRTFEQEIT